MTPRYDELAIGERIPTLTAPAVSRLQLALFAGAAADHNPIHVDDAAARAGGLPGVIAHGMLTMALLGRLLASWAPTTSLRSFSARFVAMAFPGDVISCSGVVAAKSAQDGENRVVLDLIAENQKGEKILLGKATIALI
ncbi:MAG TPA: MaoC/PaaZ C-terminal domain-containing protein [Casimicrobiaceae bacterium]